MPDRLPPPSLYFPVDPENRVLPAKALSGPLLELDCQRTHYLTTKRAVLAQADRGPFRASHPAALAAEQAAEQQLRTHMAATPEFAHNGLGPSELQHLGLDALMLELQEDLAIMLLPGGFAPERTRASYLHVCFPSGWDPASMIGKNFLAIHARVPRERGFERITQPSHAASLFDKPATRFIWSLTPDSALDHHPDTPRSATWTDTAQAFLRIERQLLWPMGQVSQDGTQAALFFIRTFIYPITSLTSEQRNLLTTSLFNLPETTRKYKGLWGHEQKILSLLIADR